MRTRRLSNEKTTTAGAFLLAERAAMSGRRSPHKQHDRSHRLLFSHARTVRDLVCGFIHEPWVEQLDFSTLEKLPSDYMSGHWAGDFEERVSDVVWRVRWQNTDLYIVILLELQSTCEQDMVLRMLVYTGLFYQRLLKEKPLRQGERLPPVLPIVFYNGDAEWWAPLEMSELIESVPASFARHVPSMSMCLIDEKRWSLEDLEALLDNVVAGLARIDKGQGPEDLAAMVRRFNRWLDQPDQRALRRDILAWLTKVVFPARLPDETIPELGDLDEFQTYVETKMQTWPEQWKAEGREEGLRLGRQEGVELGRQEGVELGLRQGQLAGEAAILRRQLEFKFGTVSATSEAHIATASADQLLAWAERLLTAETVDDVFSS